MASRSVHSSPSERRPAATPQADFARCELRATGALIALFMAMQAWLVFRLNINWDEYFFLSHIHSFQQGRLTEPFQTFHVRLLGWLAMLPLDEPGQIIAGRMVMLLCEAATLGFLYGIGRSFLSIRDTAFAIFVYCAAGYVLGHGASFRTDPLAAMLAMAALYLLVRAPARWPAAALAGFAAALALLVTIKTALYLPAFAAALAFRLRHGQAKRLIGFFSMAAIAVGVFYVLGWTFHGQLMADDPSAAPHVPGQAGRVFAKTIASPGFFPGWPYFGNWIAKGPVAAIAVLAGLALALIEAARGRTAMALAPVLLMAPLASLLFYRNAYPYFYPFILAPAALGAGLASARLDRPLYRMAATGLMAGGLIFQFFALAPRDQAAQRQIASVAHRIFPQAVSYIDRCGMLPSFAKAGFFMSSWGIEGIRASGRPALAPVIESAQPRLVIANHPLLVAALDPAIDPKRVALHPADVAALRANYRHYWGPIFLPGMSLRSDKAGKALLPLHIGGLYTLECKGELVLDGRRRTCGSALALAPGEHHASHIEGGVLALRWGDHLAPPAEAAPDGPIFHGF